MGFIRDTAAFLAVAGAVCAFALWAGHFTGSI